MNYPEFQFTDSKAIPETISCYAIGILEQNGKPYTDHLRHEYAFHSVMTPLMKETHFTGTLHAVAIANCFHQVGKVILVGLGDRATLNQEAIRKAASLVYRECIKLNSKTVLVNFFDLLDDKAYLQSFVEGILLPAYVDEQFKSQKDTKTTQLKKVELLNVAEDYPTIRLAQKIARAVHLARELVNAPANYVTPSELAKTAMTLAQKYSLGIRVLEKEDCMRLGMNAYLAVSKGSDAPPKFIHLSYKPKELLSDPHATYPKIALIGKGVTFDSGGLNLKVGASQMELMKCDMAGAAALLGAAEAIATIKPMKEVHFIIAATENMINGSATKPGDVVTASNRKTIEIDNTDAEGRLALADALVYAEQLGVDQIVDLATLTGAIVVALGEQIAGLFSTDQQMTDDLIAAATRTGEKIWPMPLEEAYFKDMDSIIADMRNSGNKRESGAITAALFLKQFVKKTQWAHLDIAGPVWTKKAKFYHNAGATGFGVRLLIDWLLHI